MNDDHRAAPAPAARPAAAQEMAAIFGEGPRIATPRATAPPPPPARPGRRAGMAALFVGALGVAVAGGVMLGRDAVGPAATSPPAPTRAARSAPLSAPLRAAPPRAAALAPTAVAPVSLPPVAAPDVPDDTRGETPAPAVVVPRAAPPAFAAAVPVPEAAPAPAPAPATYAPPVRAARMRCFGEVDCLNVRVYETDGEVARAYRAATRAGVPPRMLREYRDEWLRARDLAERRPREALRLYGMIAADLFDLAEDAAADERMPPA
ncbi:MAG: hypothetical protein PGN23_17000 [Sphingomonas adhaesiva]|uniref:hypothetical protein n=1 Tax=Sphingomonas adhaesiva TaxID=28212 RepID=UPI002FF96211